MSEPKRPLKVFLCHAHADRDAVRVLYARLVNDGVDVWLDKEKLLPGQDWELEIRKAVREADVVVVCLSKQFNQRGFRQKEVRLALDTAAEIPEGEIFIIPARLEECENLPSLEKWHWVSLFEEDGYERLMRALRTRANKIGATLQIKKRWLQNRITSQKTVKADSSDEKPVKKKHKRPVSIARDIKPFNRYLIGGGLFIAFVMVLAFGLPPLFRQPEQPVPTLFPTSTATGTSIPIPDSTVSLTETLAPSSTPTEYVNATTAPLPTEIIDAKGVSMVLVPEGEFYFGEKDAESEVFLPSFYIDTYEVTNSRYAQCVSDGGCEPPAETVLATYNYYGNPQFNDYPVVWVNITMAEEYCNWRDIRLPTEFEWEKAARGTDKRIYPWGNANDVTNLANGHGSKDGYIISSPVGAFPNGVSPYGVYDMSGNVWEWTSAITSFGGSWVYGDLYVYDRSNIGGGARFDVGFRCANDALNITSTITVDMTQTPESPASGFELIAIDKVAYRGGEASAQVKTQPGSDCALGFILPSGTLSQVGGTGPATADENGYCSWTWNVASNVNPGWGSIYIEAGGDSATYPIEIK